MNPYSELGLSSNATDEEIKLKYKSLAQTHHPDRGGDEEKFKRIKFAYEILSDPSTRREYDTTGKINKDPSVRSNALDDLSHLVINLIPNINPEHDDLILMMKNRVNEFRQNISNNIRNCHDAIYHFQKVIGRIKKKNQGENLIRSIAENQLKNRQQELLVYHRQLDVNTEMLKILEEYHYGTEEWTLFIGSGAASGNRTRDISLED